FKKCYAVIKWLISSTDEGNMMSTTSTTSNTSSFWHTQLEALPPCQFFSSASWQAIESYLTSGPTAQRGHRLVEFIKALDWLTFEEIRPNPFTQFPPQATQRIREEIQDYLQDKQSTRTEQRKKREAYKLK